MALDPNSARPDAGTTEEYQQTHPDDDPRMWGWHGQWGATARWGGFIVCAILLLMITTTQYNNQGTMWLVMFTLFIVIGILWDRHRRKYMWRK